MGQKEQNFQRLSKTVILYNFVRKNKGAWDHAKWLGLLALLKEYGYYPIDENQVGLLLEQKKARYWERQKERR